MQKEKIFLFVISGFHREAADNWDLLGYYHYSLRNDPEERSSQSFLLFRVRISVLERRRFKDFNKEYLMKW